MRVLNAAFRQPWETFVALIGTHGLAVSLGSAHCTLPRPIGAGFGSIEASLKSELYACGSGVRPVSSRSLAQRLKRRESRSMPPEHLPREIVIQTVDFSGKVVGTYCLTAHGLKERQEPAGSGGRKGIDRRRRPLAPRPPSMIFWPRRRNLWVTASVSEPSH